MFISSVTGCSACKPGVHFECFYILMFIFWGPYSDVADVNSGLLMCRTWSPQPGLSSGRCQEAQRCSSLPRRTKWSIMLWQVQPHFLPAAPSVVTLEQLFRIMWKEAIDGSPSRNHYLTRSNALLVNRIGRCGCKNIFLTFFSFFFDGDGESRRGWRLPPHCLRQGGWGCSATPSTLCCPWPWMVAVQPRAWKCCQWSNSSLGWYRGETGLLHVCLSIIWLTSLMALSYVCF